VENGTQNRLLRMRKSCDNKYLSGDSPKMARLRPVVLSTGEQMSRSGTTMPQWRNSPRLFWLWQWFSTHGIIWREFRASTRDGLLEDRPVPSPTTLPLKTKPTRPFDQDLLYLPWYPASLTGKPARTFHQKKQDVPPHPCSLLPRILLHHLSNQPKQRATPRTLDDKEEKKAI